ASLQQALTKLDGEVHAEIHFQPFELNPQMAAEGEDVGEHIAKKYGMSQGSWRRTRRACASAGPRWALLSTWISAGASTTRSMRTACCTGPSSRAVSWR